MFYADNDIYHYTVIHFGFINAGITYQRIVNMLCANMLGDTMEFYVDDMWSNPRKVLTISRT